jgi:hypothetical protein
VDVDGAALEVPSSLCTFDCPYGPKYDSSASWSYRRSGTTWSRNIGIIVRGFESIDTLTVAGGPQVSSQHFVENDSYDINPDSLYRRSKMMTRSGPLSPRSDLEEFYTKNAFGFVVDQPLAKAAVKSNYLSSKDNAPLILHSPFQMMIEEGILDKNMFSLKFPQGETDEGYLIFGGYDNTTIEGNLVSHPIFPPHTKRWSIEVSSLSMTIMDSSGNPQVLMDDSLKGYQAVLSTSHSSIYLPDPLFSRVLAPLNVTKGICQELVVDCDNIDMFPVITFRIGDQNIALTGRDYIRRIRGERTCKKPGLMECVHTFQLQYVPNSGLDTEKYFVLGLTFLERVYSVFNHDERTISCKLQVD